MLQTRLQKRVALVGLALGSMVLLERGIALPAADDPVPPRSGPEHALPLRDAATVTRNAASKEGASHGLRLDRLAARDASADDDEEAADPGGRVFDTVGFEPPPPPAPPPAPPPKPVAPAFPYAYLGSLLDDGLRTVFLTRDDRVLTVKRGDTVDGAWRVDELDASEMKLTYLPLKESKQVPLRSSP